MIVGSLLLIVVAVVLLVAGLAGGSNALLVGSIAASLLAAMALVIGARQSVTGRPGVADEFDPDLDGDEYDEVVEPDIEEVVPAIARRATEPVLVGDRGGAAPAGSVPAGGAAAATADDEDEFEDEEPPDEPAPQRTSPADAARVARMSIEVLVIDGRPRYHLAGCVHLLGRQSEPLPVDEAVELGFTPCSLCEPDSAILAEARRV